VETLKITIEFWKEGNLYIARSPELDMAAQGNSLEEAKANLREVIEIQLEEMRELGTLDEFLLEAGYSSRGGVMESDKEIISFDRQIAVAIIKNNMKTVEMSEQEYLELLNQV